MDFARVAEHNYRALLPLQGSSRPKL